MQTAVIGVGGGATVSNGDICTRAGLVVPALSAETIGGLSEFIPLVNQGIANPLDIPGVVFNPQALAKTFDLLNTDPEIDVILVTVPSRLFSGRLEGLLDAFAKVASDFRERSAEAKPVVVALSEGARLGMTESAVRGLRKAGIIAFPSLAGACRALRRFVGYHEAMNDRRKWYIGFGSDV
jgi:acyl-CoA synthetase (NDP forming)